MPTTRDVNPDAKDGEVAYVDTIETSDGVYTVETVKFPPFTPTSTYPYTGFETTVTQPDGTTYGNGPERPGETDMECHREAVQNILGQYGSTP